MIRVYIGEGAGVDVTGFVFPGGEVNISLPVTRQYASSVTINAYIKSSNDVMALVMVNEAVDRLLKPLSKRLVMPYLPYARQDRACNPGEAHGARAFATLINGMGFNTVSVMDAHSEVGVACINNCESVKQCDLVPKEVVTKLKRWWTLVCPDAGARKKCDELASYQSLDKVVYADKVRNTKTGEIVGTSLPFFPEEPWKGVIIDDICDGGRTFIELAKVMRQQGCNEIHLHVTHGIFSKGKEVFDGLIDSVSATYDWTK